MVDFEAGFPTAKAIEGKGKIKSIVMPAGDAAITWHVGPYHLMTRTSERIRKWMKEHGLEPAGPSREVYWTDPGLEPNPERWRTEMVVPVKKKNG